MHSSSEPLITLALNILSSRENKALSSMSSPIIFSSVFLLIVSNAFFISNSRYQGIAFHLNFICSKAVWHPRFGLNPCTLSENFM